MMNNELFDKILKTELDKTVVTPSASVTKAVGSKLFLQNLLVFHKIKIAIAAILLTGGTATSIYMMDEQTQAFDSEHMAILEKDPAHLNLTADLQSIDLNVIPSTKYSNNTIDRTSNNLNQNNNISKNLIAEAQNANHKVAKGNQIKSAPQKEVLPNGNSTQETGNQNEKVIKSSNEDLAIGVNWSRFDARPADLKPSEGILKMTSSAVELPIEEKINPKFGEFSVGTNLLGMGKSRIENSISDYRYNEYYWDFYNNAGDLAMQNSAEVYGKYSYGTKNIRILGKLGISHMAISDAKATYEHDEMTDPQWLNFLDVEDVSWVNTYGQDTCMACMYAQNTAGFREEMQKEHNKYQYINVPVSLGVEGRVGKFSLAANGGLSYARLIKAEGLGIANRIDDQKEPRYFWNDQQVVALQEQNSMIKKGFATLHGGVDMGVRLGKRIDLTAGITWSKALSSICNNDHMIKKDLRFNQAKVGVAYVFGQNDAIENPAF